MRKIIVVVGFGGQPLPQPQPLCKCQHPQIVPDLGSQQAIFYKVPIPTHCESMPNSLVYPSTKVFHCKLLTLARATCSRLTLRLDMSTPRRNASGIARNCPLWGQLIWPCFSNVGQLTPRHECCWLWDKVPSHHMEMIFHHPHTCSISMPQVYIWVCGALIKGEASLVAPPPLQFTFHVHGVSIAQQPHRPFLGIHIGQIFINHTCLNWVWLPMCCSKLWIKGFKGSNIWVIV